MEANTVITLLVPEEQCLVVVTVHLDGYTDAVVAHGNVVDVRDGVASLLEAEPAAPHQEWDHTWAHCGRKEERYVSFR